MRDPYWNTLVYYMSSIDRRDYAIVSEQDPSPVFKPKRCKIKGYKKVKKR